MTTYWYDTAGAGPESSKSKPEDGGILIVGSGLAGVSTAYFLLEQGFDEITIVDCGTENASYFRNAGHILHGNSESYKANISIYGHEKAKQLFKMSEQFIEQYHETIEKLNLDVDLHRGDYFFIGDSENEQSQLVESVELMEKDGFTSSYMASKQELESFNIKQATAARGCKLSAQINPAKFRNQLLEYLINQGVKYHSYKVKDLNQNGLQTTCTYHDDLISTHDATVIAGNAYSPLFSKFFKQKKLVEPFKGQIIVSKPMKQEVKRASWSRDHGYIYGTITEDNRVLIGGWRNNIEGGETGTYDLELNKQISKGLREYVETHFDFEPLEFEYEWTGIMGTSNTGLPHVGPTDDSLIYACSSFTGYGVSFSHGCAKLLADIIVGNDLPEGWHYFNPRQV